MTNTEQQNQVIAQFSQMSGIVQGDPMALTNSDAPGASLTTIPFDGSNFIAWNKQIRMALGAKLKLGFIDGLIPRPHADSADLARWERCNRMVACWILNSMSAELANSFIYTNSARYLWIEVVECYNQSTTPVVFQLKQELMKIHQGNLSATSYCTRLKRCWDEIAFLNEIPCCSCENLEKCGCKVVARFLELENQDRLMHFLMHLNNEFESVKSQILSLDPLPSLNKAYYLVMQVEKQKQITNNVIDLVAFMAAQSGNEGESSSSYERKGGNADKKDQKK